MAAAAFTGVVLAATGCGTQTDGTATPSTVNTPAATAALWDPCTQVSDQLLQTIGVDPSTKRSGVAGVEEPGFKVCTWHDVNIPFEYSLVVWSTTHTVDEFKKKPENIDFVDANVGGRNGFSFKTTTGANRDECDLIFPADQGALQVSVFNAQKGAAPPCDRAKDAAQVLVPEFPR